MARTKKTFAAMRASDLAAIASLVKVIPVDSIRAAMEECSKETIRKRKLSVEFLIYFVIFLSFYSSYSTSEVLKYVLNGMAEVLPDDARDSACEAAISQGRTRLGEDVMRLLFKSICRPLADALSSETGAFYKGHRLAGLASSTIDLQDMEVIRKEYPVTNEGEKNEPPCPKLRFNALMELGTRAIIDAEIATPCDENGKSKTLSSKDDAETRLTDTLLARLEIGLLLLGDWLYPICRFLLPIIDRGSNFMVRARANMILAPIKYLKDGSYLAELTDDPDEHLGDAKMTVRVIEYHIFNKKREIVGQGRLITSLMDHDLYPASDLVKLHYERWDCEIGHDELKTYIMDGAMKSLRSKTPALARQEFWGCLLAHYVLRKTIYEAAKMFGRNPNIGFTGTIQIIRRRIGTAILPSKKMP